MNQNEVNVTTDSIHYPFKHSRAALLANDAELDEVEEKFRSARTNHQVMLALEKTRRLEDKIRTAFWEDTKEFNSFSACMVTSISYIRYLVHHAEQTMKETKATLDSVAQG